MSIYLKALLFILPLSLVPAHVSAQMAPDGGIGGAHEIDEDDEHLGEILPADPDPHGQQCMQAYLDAVDECMNRPNSPGHLACEKEGNEASRKCSEEAAAYLDEVFDY